MTRYRTQELLKELNDIISDEDLIFFPKLKVAVDAIEQTHNDNLKKYNKFVGKKFEVPFKDIISRTRKREGKISEISNFYEDDVIVKLEFDNSGDFEYHKLIDLESMTKK